jgi:hypothetical protein
MAALEVYRTGLDKFPNDVTLLTGMSRIYEALGNIPLSAKYYKMVLNVSKYTSILVTDFYLVFCAFECLCSIYFWDRKCLNVAMINHSNSNC